MLVLHLVVYEHLCTRLIYLVVSVSVCYAEVPAGYDDCLVLLLNDEWYVAEVLMNCLLLTVSLMMLVVVPFDCVVQLSELVTLAALRSVETVALVGRTSCRSGCNTGRHPD